MRPYRYHPELRGPGFGVDITDDRPVLRAYLAWNRLFNQTASGLWRPPRGVSKRKVRIPVRAGVSICGWMLEPAGAGERLPLMLYCHGGAFYLPILPTSLSLAAHYVQELNCRVLMPEYRLTPKHPYPTPLNDCADALRWAVETAEGLGVDRDRIVIYGESAGGCLAAEVVHRCRREGLASPVGQMLIYPVTDDAGDYPSLTEYQHACWSKRANETMWVLYLTGAVTADLGDVVPMRQSSFEGLPMTYVEAAEVDVLRDQALAYAQRMRRAGVDVRCETVSGAYHGYDGELDSPLVQRVLARRTALLRKMLEAGDRQNQ